MNHTFPQRERLAKWFAMACAAMFTLCLPAGAQDAGEVDNIDEPLLYQQFHVPAGNPQSWPRLGVKFLSYPISKKEFDDHLRVLRSGSDATTTGAARFESATYTAALQEDHTLVGQAVMDVNLLDSKPVLLSLDDCRLAIGRANWKDDRPAVLALARNDAMVVLVDRDDQLTCRWSLRGRATSGGRRRYDIRLPDCQQSTLLLELPSELKPSVTRGVIIQSQPAGEGRLNWRIELGGHASTQLLLVPQTIAKNESRAILATMQAEYHIDEKGATSVWRSELEIGAEPLKRLSFAVDREVTITRAAVDGKPLAWIVSHVGDRQHVELELPEPLAPGTKPAAMLEGMSEIRLGSSWVLPVASPVGVVHKSGAAEVTVHDPLRMMSLAADGARRTEWKWAKNNGGNDSAQLTLSRRDPQITIYVDHLATAPAVHSGYHWRLSPETIVGQFIADLSGTQAPLFEIVGKLNPDWTVESVELEPLADSGERLPALREWSTDESVNDASATARLQIHLSSPVKLGETIRLRVTARRAGLPASNAMGVEELAFLELLEVQNRQTMGSIQTAPPYRVRFNRDAHLTYLNPEMLAPPLAELAAAQTDSILFQLDRNADSLQLQLSTEPPRYTAEIDVQAMVTPQELREQYLIRCLPDASAIGQLLVRFSQPTVELNWSLADQPEQPLDARRISDGDALSDDSPSTWETWEVNLPRRQSTPIELIAQRRTAISGGKPLPVALSSVVGAKSQLGRVAIQAPRGEIVQIDNRRLKAIPTAKGAAQEPAPVQAAFRYDPDDEISTSEAALTVQPSLPQTPQAWAWRQHVESTIALNGERLHRVTWEIENSGVPYITLSLSPDDFLQRLTVDGSDRPVNSDPDEFRVVLPQGVRYPLVVVEFLSRRRPLRSFDRLQPPAVDIDIPVAQRDWTCWLPPEYQTAESAGSRSSLGVKLFGPLVRFRGNSGSGRLAPFSSSRGEAVQQPGANVAGLLKALAGQYDTWGEALLQFQLQNQTDNRHLSWELLIDEAAVRAAGVTPSKRLQPLPADSDRKQLTRILSRAGLAIVDCQDFLVITSAEFVDHHRRQLQTVQGDSLAVVVSDELSRDLVRRRNNLRLIRPQIWMSSVAVPQLPWPSGQAAAMDDRGNPGWNEIHLRYHGASAVSVYDTQWLSAWGWMMFLLSFAFALCFLAGRWPWWSAAVLTIVIASILLPGLFWPVTSGGFLGLMAAAVCSLAWGTSSRRQPMENRQPPAKSKVAHGVAVLLVFSCGTAFWVAIARGQEKPLRRKVYPVFVPVDEESKQPTGSYYLPEEMYRELQRRTKAATAASGGWLIHNADYQLKLDWKESGATLAVTQLRIVFQLEVLESSFREPIRVPLSREGLTLAENWATLDGDPVEPRWGPDQREIELPIDVIGRHELVLQVRPRTHDSDMWVDFDVRIPRHAGATLHLDMPAESPPIRVPSALGQSLPVEEGEEGEFSGRLVQQLALGPTNRLHVQWPARRDLVVSSQQFDATEILWLKIGRDEVRMDARLLLKADEGSLPNVEIAADASLQLTASQPALQGRSEAASSGNHTYRFTFDDRNSPTQEVRASFKLASESALPRLVLPRLETRRARQRVRWLAVSVEPGLTFNPDDGWPAIDEAAFLAGWGSTTEKPQAVYALDSTIAHPALTIGQQQAPTTVGQQLLLSYGPRKLHARLLADVVPASQLDPLKIHLPEQFQLESVFVSTKDKDGNSTPLEARTYRSDGETLLVTLKSGRGERIRIELSGTMSVSQQPAPLPRLGIENARLASDRIEIYRHRSALVQLQHTGGLKPAAAAVEQPESWGTLVAAFELPAEDNALDGKPAAAGDDRQAAAVRVQVAPNQPAVTGHQVIVFRRSSADWSTAVNCQLQVKDGLLDEIHFDVPQNWQDDMQLQFQPPMEYRFTEVPGRNRQYLVVKPPQPISGEFSFQFIARGVPDRGQPFRVPDIRPLDVGSLQRYVVVPSHFESQRIAWQTDGLQPVELPDDIDVSIDRRVHLAFRVTSEPFEATLKAVRRVASVPQVRLADILIDLDEQGACRGVALFDLEPASLRQCTLRLPKNHRLVNVRVAGLPAQLQREDDTTWVVKLGPDRMPQRIEVTYQGHVATDQAAFELPAPVLEKLHAERTLWTIRGGAVLGLGTATSEGSDITSLQQEMLRLRAITELIKLPRYLRVENSPDEVRLWYGAWQPRWQTSRNRVTRLQLSQYEEVPDSALVSDLQVIDSDHRDVIADFDVPEASGPQRGAIDAADLWWAQTGDAAVFTRCMSKGAAEKIIVRFDRTGSTSWFGKLAIVAGVLALAVGLVWGSRRWSLGDWPLRLGRAGGVLFGIIWIVWFWPGFVGWIVVAAFLLGGKTRTPRWIASQPDSAIIVRAARSRVGP